MKDYILLAETICEDQNLSKMYYTKIIVKLFYDRWTVQREIEYIRIKHNISCLRYQKSETYKKYRRGYDAAYRASHRLERNFDAMKSRLKAKGNGYRKELRAYAKRKNMLHRIK